MTYALIVKKLYLIEEKYLEASILRGYSKALNLEYEDVIRYLIVNRYVYRILRGVFYRPSIEERRLKKLDVSVYDALSKALEIKGIKNWYFGLQSAMKIGGMTHEYYATEYLINDRLFRANSFLILGTRFKFVKLKKKLLMFGLINRGMVRYSNPEKTLLDIVYLSRYNGLGTDAIKSKISEIIPFCSKNTLIKYAKNYNNGVLEFIKAL